MKQFTSRTQKIGEIGELIALKYLRKRGYKVIERNFTINAGEIDIICQKSEVIHFVEVKTVSCETVSDRRGYNPAENVTVHKLHKIYKTIQVFLAENSLKNDQEWQIDIAQVFYAQDEGKARVSVLSNVTLG